MPDLRLAHLGLVATEYEGVLEQIVALGFEQIGEGHHAVVYAHPAHSSVVVRAGNCVDGFATYAALSRGPLRRFVGALVSVIHDLWVTDDDCLVALSESLDPLPRNGSNDPVVEAMLERLRGTDPEDMEPEAVDLLKARYPDFDDFLKTLVDTTGRRSFDAKPDNLMLRGDRLVVNDPLGNVLSMSQLRGLRRQLPLTSLSADFGISSI